MTNDKCTHYVDLARNFRPIEEDASEYRSTRELRHMLGTSTESDWETVLKARRAVVLAEAGNGKTEEFKEQARRIASAGDFACFVPVEDLDDRSLEDALDPDDADRFSSWRENNGHGHFFVDSVDEARLTNKSLPRCVRSLQKAIHGHAERATIVISCRWSDWDPNHDIRLLNDKLSLVTHPPAEPEKGEAALIALVQRDQNGGRVEDDDIDDTATTKTKASGFSIYVLESLDDQQRNKFIEAHGIENAANFRQELIKNGLLPLADRPKDLLDFIGYWQNHEQRLGSRTDMLSYVIDKRLTEGNKNRREDSTLAIAELRLGAARIAAAMVLGKTLHIAVDQPAQRNDEQWLDPIALLPERSEAEISSLLRKGVFAPASLGRAKFHHRETMEYLAAVWFKHLLDQGCPYSTVRDQLIAVQVQIFADGIAERSDPCATTAMTGRLNGT
ncbi:hypothetical protein GGD81_004596, partial [Rhodobium orientis]